MDCVKVAWGGSLSTLHKADTAYTSQQTATAADGTHPTGKLYCFRSLAAPRITLLIGLLDPRFSFLCEESHLHVLISEAPMNQYIAMNL